MYKIAIFALGCAVSDGQTVLVDRRDFSVIGLRENLSLRWAWNGVVRGADGPCVGVVFG